MGPNGAGKSTLSNVILANPEYTQTEGDIILDGENINGLKRMKEREKEYLCHSNHQKKFQELV